MIPDNTAPLATVRAPVPSEAADVKASSPSLTATLPLVDHAPLTVILPSPIFWKRAFEVTLPSQVKLSSLPTRQVLAPTLAPLLNVQEPPRLPAPLTFPMVKVLPEFCTSTPEAMSNVPLGQLPATLSVKRKRAGSSTLEVGLIVPSKSLKLHWMGVRVA